MPIGNTKTKKPVKKTKAKKNKRVQIKKDKKTTEVSVTVNLNRSSVKRESKQPLSQPNKFIPQIQPNLVIHYPTQAPVQTQVKSPEPIIVQSEPNPNEKLKKQTEPNKPDTNIEYTYDLAKSFITTQTGKEKNNYEDIIFNNKKGVAQIRNIDSKKKNFYSLHTIKGQDLFLKYINDGYIKSPDDYVTK